MLYSPCVVLVHVTLAFRSVNFSFRTGVFVPLFTNCLFPIPLDSLPALVARKQEMCISESSPSRTLMRLRTF